MSAVPLLPAASRGFVARTLAPVSVAVAGRGVRPPLAGALTPHRRVGADEAVAQHLAEARALAPGVAGGDAEARRALSSLATRALGTMRATTRRAAADAGGLAALAARIDVAFHAPDAREILDDPGTDDAVRVRVSGHLDAVNHLLGNYAAFWASLRPLLSGSRPVTVLDLASGHGGFALDAARRARAEGLAVTFVATDLCAEPLRLGEARALAEGLPVRFCTQDALDLSNHAEGAFDVVTSTQSLHHFAPGQVALMIADASRIGREALLIDGARSMLAGGLVTTLGFVSFLDTAWANDTWVSFRRFFAPEELEVLARLAAPERRVSSEWVAPGHCRVWVPAVTSVANRV